jgi:hypothetical protein
LAHRLHWDYETLAREELPIVESPLPERSSLLSMVNEYGQRTASVSLRQSQDAP